MPLSESMRTELSARITRSRVVLFMKGSRTMPQCGFSAQVVQILDGLVPDYETVDVLRSPELRDGIKEFSQWPTIPQLYVGGQFVGGCDIVRELNATGELQKLIGAHLAHPLAHRVEAKVPVITMTDAAVQAFGAALADAGSDGLRLSVDPQFRHDLFLGPPEAGDVTTHANGMAIALDPASAGRADGVHIDFVAAPTGAFKIHNPNEPHRVKPLTPKELVAMVAKGQKVELFDVRTAQERDIAKLAAARPLDHDGERYLASLDRSAPLVFHCHHGSRSRAAAEHALTEGFTNVYNLEGGIDAWSQTVDPSIPRY